MKVCIVAVECVSKRDKMASSVVMSDIHVYVM